MDDSRQRRPEKEREVPAPEQVWGSEHPKLSGQGWRRIQQLEPVAALPAEPAGPSEAREPAEMPSTTAAAIDALRRDSDARLAAMEDAMRAIAKTVQEAAWSTSTKDVRSELDQLRRSLASLRGEAVQVDPTREIGEFLKGETQRIRGVIGEELRTTLARSDQDGRALERIRREVESLARSMAELRTSLPSSSTDELAGIVQDEARATRDVLARLRAEGPGGQKERVDTLRVELESVREAVHGLISRVSDLTSGDTLIRSIEEGADRSRADLQDVLNELRGSMNDLRARSEHVDAGLTEMVARAEAGRDGERLAQILRTETDRIRIELAQAAETTDARARGVMASLAREVIAVAEQQKELREELRRLAARIVGRPVL